MKEKRSSVILVFNDKKELLLQLRGPTDKSYPLHWDFSAAGGIDPNENHRMAARRELQEELGIGGKLEYLGEELYSESHSSDRLYVYKTVHNDPFKPDLREISKIKFFALEEIEKMLKLGKKFHPEFPFLWNKGIILQAASYTFSVT